jgi:hypothetical protein
MQCVTFYNVMTKGLFEPLKWCKLKSKWPKEKLVLSKFCRCMGLCYAMCVSTMDRCESTKQFKIFTNKEIMKLIYR